MLAVNIDILIEKAHEIAGVYNAGEYCTSGGVGAALLTAAGNIYTGVCIDTACGLGFCAEHAAIAEMLKHRESEIKMIAAVNTDGKVLPPCGRCRELMYQVNPLNIDTQVIIGADKLVTLRELLPYTWQDVAKQGLR